MILVSRNLILALFLFKLFMKWIFTPPPNHWDLMWKESVTDSGYFYHPKFTVSGHFILTESLLLNGWWLALCKYFYKDNFLLLRKEMELRSNVFIIMLIRSIKIWFTTPPWKPLDKPHHSSAIASTYNLLMNGVTHLLMTIEDVLYYLFNINIDLCQCIQILSSILIDWIQYLFTVFINIDFTATVEEGESWFEKVKIPVETLEVNVCQRNYFKFKSTVVSKVVLSLSTKSKRNELDNNAALDSDSYLFAIDTCTSENICKNKELFVGEIKPCKNLFVQGVGGRVRAS